MTELCEWNPKDDRPAVYVDRKTGATDGCQNEAELSVGVKENWHICASCAALPRFKRMTRRVSLR